MLFIKKSNKFTFLLAYILFKHACICFMYKLAPTVRRTQNIRVAIWAKKPINIINQRINHWIELAIVESSIDLHACLLVHRSRASISGHDDPPRTSPIGTRREVHHHQILRSEMSTRAGAWRPTHQMRAPPPPSATVRSYGGQPLLGLLVSHDAPGPPSCCR